MTRKKIENQYKEKINLLIKFNKNYYEYSDPIVDDGEYDKLKKEILALEKNTEVLNLILHQDRSPIIIDK